MRDLIMCGILVTAALHLHDWNETHRHDLCAALERALPAATRLEDVGRVIVTRHGYRCRVGMRVVRAEELPPEARHPLWAERKR
jgi:hypothetical protein